jgi:hypothetical protein
MPVNNLLSNSLKFGFATFLPGQEIFSLLVRFQAPEVHKNKKRPSLCGFFHFEIAGLVRTKGART